MNKQTTQPVTQTDVDDMNAILAVSKTTKVIWGLTVTVNSVRLDKDNDAYVTFTYLDGEVMETPMGMFYLQQLAEDVVWGGK